MSRTSFAVRFRQAVGVPPLTYLLGWRMSLAARALRQAETPPVAVLAREVGYTSESAFSNAFKRVMGVGPRRYRDTARAAMSAEAHVSPAVGTTTEPVSLDLSVAASGNGAGIAAGGVMIAG
jgi:AraC-like DNA-binding protein